MTALLSASTVALGDYVVQVRTHLDGVRTEVSYRGAFVAGQFAEDYPAALLLAGGAVQQHTDRRNASRDDD